MGCKATKTNIMIVLALALIYAILFTSKVSAETIDIRSYPQRTLSFEIKPLSLLPNFLPRSRGFDGEFEAALGKKVAVVASLSHTSLLASANETSESQEANKEFTKETGSSKVSLGGRYYHNITGHSLFAGAKFGGGTQKSIWEKNSQDYVDSQMIYLMAGESGFRWLWKNRMHLRLAGGFEVQRTISHTVSALSEAGNKPSETALSIKRNHPRSGIRMRPYFDFGVGVTI